MLLELALFILGFILLIKGSDYFVKNASVIAKKIGISEFIIGLTLVAIGTSLPELASCVFASFKQQSGLILGEIVGSNIANIALVGGILAIIGTIKTKKEVLKRDGHLLIFTIAIFFLFMVNNQLTRIAGIIFLLIYIAYLAFVFESKTKPSERDSFAKFIRYFIGFRYIQSIKKQIKNTNNQHKQNILPNLLIMIISGTAIYFGARFLVEQAIFFAGSLGISTSIIGVSIVALGTSLPELSVSISAVKNKLGHIALGNIIGSCIANILLIIGISTLINPLTINNLTLFYTVPIMMLVSTLLFLFMEGKQQLTRKHGIIFLIIYIIFLVSLIFIR